LQHCCKTRWIAMLRVLPPTNKTCFATNQVVEGFGKLLQKVESSSTFFNKICSCSAFYRPWANLFRRKWRNFRVWRDSHVILSNQKTVFTQLMVIARQVWTWVVKQATLLFNLFCSNVQIKFQVFVGRYTITLIFHILTKQYTNNR